MQSPWFAFIISWALLGLSSTTDDPLFYLRKLLSPLMKEKRKLTQSKMERFHSVSFGLDLDFSCQGMQDITTLCLVRKQNLPSKPATWHTEILVPLNEEHTLCSLIFFCCINKSCSVLSLTETGFSSYAEEELIQHISQQNHRSAQEYQSHDPFQDHPRAGQSQERAGATQKASPKWVRNMQTITHLKHKKSIKATMRAPTEIQWPR